MTGSEGRTMRNLLSLLLLAVVPALAAGQGRDMELETRQAARADALEQLNAWLERRAQSRYGWAPYADPCGWPVASLQGQYGGYSNRSPAYGPMLYGYRVPAGRDVPRGVGYGASCRPGQGYPGYPLDSVGYGWLPNPYDDWRQIWGRGWLDDAEIPPYHRFQYRFFPETLPDPAHEGYVRPGARRATASLGPVRRPPTGACARLQVVGPDGTEAVLVPLPLFGALTPEALRAVVLDRLRRGGGVVVRSINGYVFRFPPADAIQELTATGC